MTEMISAGNKNNITLTSLLLFFLHSSPSTTLLSSSFLFMKVSKNAVVWKLGVLVKSYNSKHLQLKEGLFYPLNNVLLETNHRL